MAMRVAQERGCVLGEEVGYSIRFEDVTTPGKTRIKYMTDGMLLREALVDPLLSKYAVIMLDEAHERSIYTDILMGLLKKIRRKRPDLRLIVSSATIDAKAFRDYFADNDKSQAAVISLEGRTYPVDILYLSQPTENYLHRILDIVHDIHVKEKEGDILVFLTGRDEIENCLQEISNRENTTTLSALPLYAGLSSDRQLAVFEPAVDGKRKVIFSTNVAEASVTIDGIIYVVDCGFVKLKAFNPVTGIESLSVTPVSQASAAQRSGRAGRTRAGKCFRIYTESAYEQLTSTTPAEIQRCDMSGIILQLKSLGIDNIVRFDFMTPPPSSLVIGALELLYSLKAIDDYGKLTIPLGSRMAELPLTPMVSHILLTSTQYGCTEQILTIAAMTSVQNVFIEHDKKPAEGARRKFAAEEGDHLTLLNVYHAFVLRGSKSPKWCHDNLLNFKALMRAVSIRAQLVKYLERFDISRNSSELSSDATTRIRKCLVSGFFAHAACMQPDGSYQSPKSSLSLHVHPTSIMFNRKTKWVIFHEVVETGDKIYIRDLTVIEESWLTEIAPHFYEIRETKRHM